MKYIIYHSNSKGSRADERKELLKQISQLRKEDIEDIRKLYKSGVTDSVLELYKPSYQRNLMECRRGNVSGYIKFFLQCIIDQCNAYIYKLDRIKEIYKEDMKTIEAIKGNSVYKIMPVIMKQIVFTKKEIQELSGVSPNVVSKIINQLVDLNVIISDSTKMKKGYRYQKIYEVFVGTREF